MSGAFSFGHVKADAQYHKSKILMEHPACSMLGENLQTSVSQFLCETSFLRYSAQWSTYWAHQRSLGSRSNLRVGGVRVLILLVVNRANRVKWRFIRLLFCRRTARRMIWRKNAGLCHSSIPIQCRTLINRNRL